MLRNLFMAYYRGYLEQQETAPRAMAVVLLTFAEIGLVLLAIAILKVKFARDYSYLLANKDRDLVVYLILLLGQYFYFKKQDMQQLTERYSKKSEAERLAWRVGSGLLLVIPLLAIVALFTK